MRCVHYSIELLAEFHQAFGVDFKIRRRLVARYLGAVVELRKYLSLIGFVAENVQAKRRQSQLVQPRAHHFESRRLLRHKQDALASVQCVGNYVGDSLRLARAGRAKHYETTARNRLLNGFELRTVATYRQQHICGRVFAIHLLGGHRGGRGRGGQATINERIDDGAFCEQFGV